MTQGDILPGRVAGARSGPGLGPRSRWQLHREQGYSGWGPSNAKQGHCGHVRREWGRAGEGTWVLLTLRRSPEKGSPIFSGNLPWLWLGTLSLRERDES